MISFEIRKFEEGERFIPEGQFLAMNIEETLEEGKMVRTVYFYFLIEIKP